MINLITLRALKGAPLSILIAMFLAKQPVGESWLISVTGYSQNTIRKGCSFLLETQLILRNGRYQGYVLSKGAMQLPLGMAEIGESHFLTLPTPTTTSTLNKYEDDFSEENAAEEELRESFFDSRLENDSLLVLLYSAGIMEPTASRLLEKEWVTKAYLEAHIEKANRENTATALLIHRIRSHDPMPKSQVRDYEFYTKSWGLTH